MKTVKLSQGRVALVDDEDYTRLSQYRWYLMNGRYAFGKIEGKWTLMHVFLLGKKEGLEIDHINQDKLDNRKSNLRHVTRSVNMFNVGLTRANKSGFKGVCWDKRRNKWRATIKLNYKQVYNSSFLTKEEAISARQAAFNEMIIPITS